MQIFYFKFKLYISECASISVKIYTYIKYIHIHRLWFVLPENHNSRIYKYIFISTYMYVCMWIYIIFWATSRPCRCWWRCLYRDCNNSATVTVTATVTVYSLRGLSRSTFPLPSSAVRRAGRSANPAPGSLAPVSDARTAFAYRVQDATEMRSTVLRIRRKWKINRSLRRIYIFLSSELNVEQRSTDNFFSLSFF